MIRKRSGMAMGRLIFLGTGDPLNDERAQTSLALPQADGTTILFDTSSGTILLRQLRAAGISLASIRHIFVSHRLFDHAGGTPRQREGPTHGVRLPNAEGPPSLSAPPGVRFRVVHRRAAGAARPGTRHIFAGHRHFDHAGGLAPLLVALTAIPQSN